MEAMKMMSEDLQKTIDMLEAKVRELQANVDFEEELRSQFIEHIWEIVGDGNPYDYPAQVIRYTQDMKDELAALKIGTEIASKHD